MRNSSSTQLKETPRRAPARNGTSDANGHSVLVPGTRMPLGENVLLCHDRASGLSAAIAIDDTTLGPGLGGVRWRAYPSFNVAVDEACRLARVMTLKNALADIPYGGAKSVILRTEGTDGVGGDPLQARAAQLLAFAGFVNRLGGAYVPGVDMGTSVEDLATIATVSPWASCDHRDPSPATARGVFFAIEAAVFHTLGGDLRGVRVTVQGVGHVGAALAERLAAAGALVTVADVDRIRAAEVASRVHGTAVDPEVVHAQECEVFAPCASARVLRAQTISELQCSLVIGAANDVLSERADAALLAERGIVYVPDFVSNAGGVIDIHAGRVEWTQDQLTTALAGIGTLTTRLLESADADHSTPLAIAEGLASDRLGHTVTIPD
jgi:leucine dehydrogenase